MSEPRDDTSDAKPGDANASDAKASAANASDAKASDAKASDAYDAKASAAKPAGDDVADDLAQIPRLPRGGGFKLAKADLVKIAFTAAILVMVLVIRRPCSETVGSFVTDFDNPPAGSSGSSGRTPMPKPDNVDVAVPDPCEVALRADMSDAETRAAIDRAQACAAARRAKAAGMGSGSGSGSASAGSARP